MHNNLMCFNEIKSSLDALVDPMIDLLLPAQAASFSFSHALLKTPKAFKDYFLYVKFEHFLEAIRKKNLDESTRFSNKFFSDDSLSKKNALRLFNYIDKSETLDVVDYIANASRAAGNGLISEENYYRILFALTRSYSEDLNYLKIIACNEGAVKSDIRVLALAQSGLMLLQDIDLDEPAENQGYIVTSLGKMVDQFALSYDDEERYNYWKRKNRAK